MLHVLLAAALMAAPPFEAEVFPAWVRFGATVPEPPMDLGRPWAQMGNSFYLAFKGRPSMRFGRDAGGRIDEVALNVRPGAEAGLRTEAGQRQALATLRRFAPGVASLPAPRFVDGGRRIYYLPPAAADVVVVYELVPLAVRLQTRTRFLEDGGSPAPLLMALRRR